MNTLDKTARHYHWLGDTITDFVVEPHTSICCNRQHTCLNMVAVESEDARQISTAIARENPDKTLKALTSMKLAKRHNVSL